MRTRAPGEPAFQPEELVVEPAVRARCAALGDAVLVWGGPDYPSALRDDPEPPPFLFVRGDVRALETGLAVGIVGTRNATLEGRDIARWFGRELSALGVPVVSGLAIGIDAAAHRGAVEAAGAAPVAVVGSGLDVPYPRSNARLFAEVASLGAVVSEHPPGTPPMAHHFPLRNRLIAALSSVLLVVESRGSGGSLITVEQAEARGRAVLAVPGSVRSPTAEGTNRLLRDGCTVVLDPEDVLVALGLAASDQQPLPFVRQARRRSPTDPARRRREPATAVVVAPPGPDDWLLEFVHGHGTTVDDLVLRSGGGLDAVLAALGRLDDDGVLVQEGPWVRRVTKR